MGKASTRLVSLAVAVIAEAILIVILVTMLDSVKRTSSIQMQALAEVQSDYEERDAALLDGEIVSAAEAASITRKYRSKSCRIYKDGAEVDNTAPVSRNLFNESSNWRVDLDFAVNGNIDSVYFSRPSGAGITPATVDEAKALIANTVGAPLADTWSSIITRLNGLSNINEKRENFATLLSMPAESDWDVIYERVAAVIGSHPSSFEYEQFIVYPGNDYTWSMQSPSFCYLRGGGSYGLVIFNGNSYSLKGDFDGSCFTFNVNTKTVHNFTSDAITIYVVKE